MKYHYSVYDFIIQSELELPGFPAASGITVSSPTVTIQFGKVSKTGLQNPTNQGLTYQTNSTEFWLNIPSIARFLVSNGQKILIDPVDQTDDDSIRTFLLSTCIETLLRQRQLILISGFALKLGSVGVAFAGTPGTGQSMLQGLFYKNGYSFLDGHFTVLNHQGFILPGIPQMELWPAITSVLGIDTQHLNQVRPEIQQYILPLIDQYYRNPLPVQTIYTVAMHQQPNIIFSTIDGAEKIKYLEPLIKTNDVSVNLWYENNHSLPNLDRLKSIPLVCINLPTSGLKLQQIIQAIENDVGERSLAHV